MQIDIEKLNRKTPYPEPEDSFFQALQDRVISKTTGAGQEAERIIGNKKTKVFALNFQWMAAAAVVLIAGITAFFGFNNDPEIQLAKQKAIVDSVYEVETPISKPAISLAENHTSSEKQEIPAVGAKGENHSSSSDMKTAVPARSYNNEDRQDYAVVKSKKQDSDVEKVLAAFTPDQIKDLDKNSEQDVYLDLYN